jgi:hypothetical protein
MSEKIEATNVAINYSEMIMVNLLISEQGIFGGANGYIRLAISDFNLDGYPDIYVGNDFHEDDYYY